MTNPKVWLFLVLLSGMARPATSAAQPSSEVFEIQASGLVSAFHFTRGPQSKWRESSALRFRGVLHDRFFGEFSFSASITSEESHSCLAGESCTPDLSAWHYSILSGGFGWFLHAGAWKPFVGVSGGRFRTEDEIHTTWAVLSGLERSLGDWLGLVFEYRLGRVDWPFEGGVNLNHEIGVGLSISVSTILRNRRSAL